MWSFEPHDTLIAVFHPASMLLPSHTSAFQICHIIVPIAAMVRLFRLGEMEEPWLNLKDPFTLQDTSYFFLIYIQISHQHFFFCEERAGVCVSLPYSYSGSYVSEMMPRLISLISIYSPLLPSTVMHRHRIL